MRRLRSRGSTNVVMRWLLSLDFVLEHPGMRWLPTEAEKVDDARELIEGPAVADLACQWDLTGRKSV